MSFIVEDGSGKKGATSYATIAFFRAYMADRGIDVTTWIDATVQGYLVAATDYIDTRWGLRFLGERLWSNLYSRSVFTLTGQPTDGETVTIGVGIYTFRDVAVDGTDVEIQDTLIATLEELVSVVGTDANEDVMDFMFADLDTAALTVFTVTNGVATTDTVALGSWNAVVSAGASSYQQPLEFPREDLYDRANNLIEGVPDRVKEATCEYAYRAKTAALAPDPTIDNTVQSVSTTVGPISKSVTYATGSILQPIKPYPAADRLLQEYVRPGGVIRS
jgi:hypothetical protein